MREIYKSGVTPQQKLVAINQKFGNTNVKSQQGTSRIIYDSIRVTGQTNFRFFEDSASRTFPLTNTGSEGNKLGVGDTMVIAQVVFNILLKNIQTGAWIGYTDLVSNGVAKQLGYFNVEIANNQVIKKLTLSEGVPSFNKDTLSGQSAVIDLETSIVIPPLLPFVVELQLPDAIAGFSPNFEVYAQCQIIGVGGIIAPRTTF
jgi:hypothetical protein